MKKLFALLLTAALLLGLATTAMAGWGYTASTSDSDNFVTLSVIKYVKHTADGGSYYYTVDASAQAVNDAEVYYAVKLVVPSDVKTTAVSPIKLKVTYEGISATDFSATLAAGNSYGDIDVDADGYLSTGTYYLTGAAAGAGEFTLSTNLTVNQYINKLVCRDTDTAKVTATVTKKTDFSEIGDTFTKGSYTVLHNGETEVIVNKTGEAELVTFTRDSTTGKVTKVLYTNASGNDAKVVLNSDATYGFTLNAVDGAAMDDDDESYVKNLLAFCGFTMADVASGSIYMSDANVIANFGTNLKVTSYASWAAAQDPIILDAVTVIPKTGDVVAVGAAVTTLLAAAGALSLRKRS